MLNYEKELVAEKIYTVGQAIMNRGRKSGYKDRDFYSFFGCSQKVCADIWELLDPKETMPEDLEYKHLLWALMFLKLYTTEAILCALAGGVSKKTFRKWSWLVVNTISYLEADVVSN